VHEVLHRRNRQVGHLPCERRRAGDGIDRVHRAHGPQAAHSERPTRQQQQQAYSIRQRRPIIAGGWKPAALGLAEGAASRLSQREGGGHCSARARRARGPRAVRRHIRHHHRHRVNQRLWLWPVKSLAEASVAIHVSSCKCKGQIHDKGQIVATSQATAAILFTASTMAS
jgi:hypothetical protein